MRVVPVRQGTSQPPPSAWKSQPRPFVVTKENDPCAPKNVRKTQATGTSCAGTGTSTWEASPPNKQLDWTWHHIMKNLWGFIIYWLRLIVTVLPFGLPFFVPIMPKHDMDRSDTGAWRDRFVIWWLMATTAVGLAIFADGITFWCTFSGDSFVANTRIVCAFVLVVAVVTLAIQRRRWKILATALVFCTVFVPAVQLFQYVGWWPKGLEFLPNLLFGTDLGTATLRGHLTAINMSMLHISIKALQVLPYHVHMPLAILSLSLVAAMQCATAFQNNEATARPVWGAIKLMSTATLILVLHERESRFQRLQSIELDRLAEREKHFLTFLARGIDGPLGRITAFLRHLDDPPGRFNELLQGLQAQSRESFGSWPLREHQEDVHKIDKSASVDLLTTDAVPTKMMAVHAAAVEDHVAKIAEQNQQSESASDILGASDAQLTHMLTHVQHSTTVIVDTVHNCHKLQKIDSGTYEPQRDIIDLRELVETCLGMHSREREAGLCLKLLMHEPMVIVSDRRLWLHVLMNLIGNAVKFTGAEVGTPCTSGATKQPSVTVSISRAHYQSCVTVDVIDNGPGVAEGDQERIFGKYSQACRGFGPQGLGTGLGLYLSTKIVKLMRGQLRLCSPIEADRGSKFTFTVPCELAAANTAPSHDVLGDDQPELVSGISALLLARRSLQLHVLLVEDDDLNVLLLKTALKKGFSEHHGAQIVITRTRTAEEALTLIGGAMPHSKTPEQSEHLHSGEGEESSYCIFDAIIIDQHLEPAGGVMKGSQLAQHIKSLHRTHPPCVVLVSGNSDILSERDAFLECGASVVWNKPYPTPQAMVHDLTLHLRARAGVSLAKTDQLPQCSAIEAYSSTSATLQEGVVAASNSHIEDAPGASVDIDVHRDSDDEANAGSHAGSRQSVAPRLFCMKRLSRGFWRMAMPFPDLIVKELVAKRWQIASMHDRDFVRAATIVELIVGIILQAEDPIVENETRSLYLFVIGISIHLYLTWNPKRWLIAMHVAGCFSFLILCHRVHISLDMCGDQDMDDPRHRNTDSRMTCESYRNAEINFDSVQMLFIVNAGFVFFRVFSFHVHATWLTASSAVCFIGAIVNTSNYAVLQDRFSYKHIVIRQVLQLVWMALMIISLFLVAIVINRSWVFHFVDWQRKQRALEQERALISFLCHEIKNPVSAIRFFVTKLDVRLRRAWDMQGASNLRELRAMMPRVMTATTTIVNIVRHCHELARIESGSFTVVNEPVDLRQIATATCNAEMSEHDSHICIELECEDRESFCVVGDRCLWSHAMRNMISNAVDMTLAGVRDAVEPYPRTAVGGRGKQIPQNPGDKPVVKMQMSCSRVNGDAQGVVNMQVRFTERAPLHGGRSNMRLHTLHKVAQLQGGELHVTYPASQQRRGNPLPSRGGGSGSLAPDEGELSLVVPCEFADTTMAKPSANATEGKTMVEGDDWQFPCKLDVLIVEDDNLNVIVMKTCLATGFRKRFGVEIIVSHATTAEAALKIINEEEQNCPFDIVIIDQHMEPAGGVMKGAQLVHDLYLRPYKQPPVLVLASGNSDNPSERTQFFACGASVVWSKPYPEPADMVDDLVAAMRATSPRLH